MYGGPPNYRGRPDHRGPPVYRDTLDYRGPPGYRDPLDYRSPPVYRGPRGPPDYNAYRVPHDYHPPVYRGPRGPPEYRGHRVPHNRHGPPDYRGPLNDRGRPDYRGPYLGPPDHRGPNDFGGDRVSRDYPGPRLQNSRLRDTSYEQPRYKRPRVPPQLQFKQPPLRRRPPKPKRKSLVELINDLAGAKGASLRFKADSSNVKEARPAKQKKKQTTQMRGWFLPPEIWFSSQKLDKVADASKILPDSSPRVPVTPNTPKLVSHTAAGVEVPEDANEDAFCVICGERFHKIYNSNTHKWIYQNTLRAPRLGDAIVHIACDKDYDYSDDGESPSIRPDHHYSNERGMHHGSHLSKRLRYEFNS